MYDRAPRTLTQTHGSTAPGVGPGTYSNEERTQGKEVSYAPFLSMSVRESFLTVNDQLAAAPGPGHYSVEGLNDRGKGACSLNNKSERFSPPFSKTPGPGAYSISKHSDWIRKTYPPPSVNSKKGHVTFYRQGTAPSIPMPGQDYGYDEDDEGVLKAQLLPRKDSTMGPAYYNVSREVTAATKRYKGVHFGMLKSQRNPFRGRDGPGPGDYDSENASILVPMASTRSVGSVESNLPRYHELVTRIEEKKAVPGPGQYEIKSQFYQTSLQEEEDEEMADSSKAPFGSRQQRFLMSKHTSPACTTYQDPRTAFDSTNRLTGMRKVPFGQTSSRFPVYRQGKRPPGPGAYNNNEVTSLAAELTKKAMMQGIQKHPFGSTSVRTAPLIKKDEFQMPGPAHYQQREGSSEARLGSSADGSGLAGTTTSGGGGGGGSGLGRAASGLVKVPANPTRGDNRLSYTFASTSKRLYSPPSIVTDIPPPGSYEVSESHSKSQGKVEQLAGVIRGAFLSSSDRFAPPRDILLEEPDAYNPGPGEYKHTNALCKGKPGLLCFRDNRFKPIKSCVPGPGAYEMCKSQKDTLLQGTFNTTLDNPLGSSSEQNKRDVTSAKKQAFILGV